MLSSHPYMIFSWWPLSCIKSASLSAVLFFSPVGQGGSRFNSHTLNHFKELGLDATRAVLITLTSLGHAVLRRHHALY